MPNDSLLTRLSDTAIEPVMTDAGPLQPILVDAATAARLLACSPRTVFSLAKRGELPRVMIGRAVRYSVQTLQEFCKRQERIGEAKAQ
jgi:excisionase family DNA binding protein